MTLSDNMSTILILLSLQLNSIFRVLEPVGEKINEGAKASAGFGSRLSFRSTKSEWFRIYRDFFLPSDSFDVIFLKARIAIFCAKGFEIMNLHEYVVLLSGAVFLLFTYFLQL